VDATGPDTNSISVSPNPSNGTLGFDINTPAVRVAATVADPVINGLQSNIKAAEVFVDSAGSNGSGLAFLAGDGVYDSPVEAIYADIPLTVIAQLGDGSHILYVHGQDFAGNWGAMSSTVLIIDKTSPTVSNVTTTLTNTTINLTATAADPSPGSVAKAEWFEGNDPGKGLGYSMSVSGGTVAATIDVGTWTSGSHTLFVRAGDSAGN
jgi:hypothetical protein